MLLPVQVDPSVQSSSKTVSNSTTPVPGNKSNRLLGMFKFKVPRPTSGGTRSICDELNDYMGEAETDFRRLWINPKFANFKILHLARKIFATTATSALPTSFLKSRVIDGAFAQPHRRSNCRKNDLPSY